MDNITIKEGFILPSLGKIYNTQFDPHIELRSMTVAEEMKRLTPTDTPYKSMSDIIDSCLLTKLPISAYDMCIGDYQYLLHRLRVVTYGADYKIQVRCPNCGALFTDTIDLDSLKVNIYTEDFNQDTVFKLPVSNDTIEISYLTPRDLDYIDTRKRELKKQFPDMQDDPTLMLNLLTIIKSINGQVLNPVIVESYIKKLPLRDYQLIIKRAEQLNRKVGVDINIHTQCTECKKDVNTSFRFTNEFFRPTLDD